MAMVFTDQAITNLITGVMVMVVTEGMEVTSALYRAVVTPDAGKAQKSAVCKQTAL